VAVLSGFILLTATGRPTTIKRGHIVEYKWQQWLHKQATVLRHTYIKIFFLFQAVKINCNRLIKKINFFLFYTASSSQV